MVISNALRAKEEHEAIKNRPLFPSISARSAADFHDPPPAIR
jgi:hypothetical protein